MQFPHPRLVVIFGPPASGKLTVGKALSIKLNFILFSNHDTIDFVRRFVPLDSPDFLDTVDRIRELLIRRILMCRNSVIFTFAYSGSAGDTDFLRKLMRIAADAKAGISFVRLV